MVQSGIDDSENARGTKDDTSTGSRDAPCYILMLNFGFADVTDTRRCTDARSLVYGHIDKSAAHRRKAGQCEISVTWTGLKSGASHIYRARSHYNDATIRRHAETLVRGVQDRVAAQMDYKSTEFLINFCVLKHLR